MTGTKAKLRGCDTDMTYWLVILAIIPCGLSGLYPSLKRLVFPILFLALTGRSWHSDERELISNAPGFRVVHRIVTSRTFLVIRLTLFAVFMSNALFVAFIKQRGN